MIPIIKEGTFDADVRNQINLMMAQAMGLTTGDVYFLDPWKGYDGNSGLYPSLALQSLAAGYAKLREGKNDVLALIGNGLTTATARLSSGFTWGKNAAHFLGVCSPVTLSQRARIAPTAGIAAFANFFTVSSSGCLFSNLQWFHGFTTGAAAQICMTVTGGRNAFLNCHLAGMGDQESADSTTSRSLKIATTGENLFSNCTIGIDTITRGAANASIEFAGVGNPRNIFRDCVMPFMCDASTPLGIKIAAAAASDRFQLFDRCLWLNAVGSTSTTMTALATFAASIGGLVIFKDNTLVGITDFFSDATTAAQMYIDGAAPTAATSGLAVNPA